MKLKRKPKSFTNIVEPEIVEQVAASADIVEPQQVPEEPTEISEDISSADNTQDQIIEEIARVIQFTSVESEPRDEEQEQTIEIEEKTEIVHEIVEPEIVEQVAASADIVEPQQVPEEPTEISEDISSADNTQDQIIEEIARVIQFTSVESVPRDEEQEQTIEIEEKTETSLSQK